ncbi:hypothetical protein [Mycoplasmoides pneumoniae]|uniref:hypothetical protein n=1 Tax=Mycoplasmoides pneumoniae TaxID=2104 RepID=UPI00139639F1|nr:hypothetical protein [Mycoplasmoides pneumoniae]
MDEDLPQLLGVFVYWVLGCTTNICNYYRSEVGLALVSGFTTIGYLCGLLIEYQLDLWSKGLQAAKTLLLG